MFVVIKHAWQQYAVLNGMDEKTCPMRGVFGKDVVVPDAGTDEE